MPDQQDKLDIYLTAGTIGDGSAGTTFANVLQSHGYDYTFKQVNEGHSWGNWRALLDDILQNLVGPTPILAADFNEDGVVDAADRADFDAGFGKQPATHADGDADSDRDVDGADLLIWQRQLSAPPSSAISLPEPAAALLALFATLPMIFRFPPLNGEGSTSTGD